MASKRASQRSSEASSAKRTRSVLSPASVPSWSDSDDSSMAWATTLAVPGVPVSTSVSPLRPIEFVLSLMAMSVIRLLVGFVPVTIAAIWFFGFNLWGLGIALAVFFANLFLTAWAMGMFCSGLVLRHGMGAEGLTWSLMFILLPLACVYYPVSTLPAWLQPVAWALPPTAVFEGMRALVLEHTFHPDLMIWAFALNALWFTAGAISFFWLLRGAREAGSLISVGE